MLRVSRFSLQHIFILLLLKAFFACLALLYLGIGLAPDEAQYWTWSQELNLAYYSKPPWIAWQIGFGCSVFGNNEWGVRCPSIVISLLITLCTYWLSKNLQINKRGCFISAFIMAFCPIGILSSFAATTDTPLILAWTFAAGLFVKDLEAKTPKSMEKIALTIALGALCKWPIYALWVFIIPFSLLYLHTSPKRLVKCLLISNLGLLPSLVWNIENNWVTFRHVYASVVAPSRPAGGNPLEFFAAQFATLSPIYYLLTLFALYHQIKNYKKSAPSHLFCLSLSLSFWLFCHSLSFFNKVQANWAVCAYPTIIPLTAKLIEEKNSLRPYYRLGSLLSITLSCTALLIPSLQEHNLLNIPYRLNPFQHSMGWNMLRKTLKDSSYEPQKDFLFAESYQNTSILSFYGPEQKKAYFFNLSQRRKNQFSFWPGMKEEQYGKTGFFLSIHKDQASPQEIEEKKRQLLQYFEKVEFLGSKALFFSNGQAVKFARIYRCENYNGKEPSASTLY